MEGKIVFCGRAVAYRSVSDASRLAAGEIKVEVAAKVAATRLGLEIALAAALVRRAWWLLPEFRAVSPREKFLFEFGGLRRGVWNYGQPLTSGEQNALLDALLFTAASLRRRDRERLRAVIILGSEMLRPRFADLGAPAYGLEGCAMIPRASFESEDYAPNIARRRIDGVVAHELGHALLEERLQPYWTEFDLGWRDLPPPLKLRLPDRSVTDRANVRPWDCPTESAQWNEPDDRAESLVAWLYDPVFCGRRADILDQVLRRRLPVTSADLNRTACRLPELPERIAVVVRPDAIKAEVPPKAAASPAEAPVVLDFDLVVRAMALATESSQPIVSD